MGQMMQTNKKENENDESNKLKNILGDDGYKELKPMELFGLWFQESFGHGVKEPFSMTLSTASLSGRPYARIVSLGGFDEVGFYFSTTVTANKVQQLEENPYACASFYWCEVQRTVRIEGKVQKVDKVPNEGGFSAVPKEVKIGVSASPTTSLPVKDGDWKTFLENFKQVTEKYKDADDIPQPDFIKDYVIIPERIEFMQTHNDLPSDRIQFTRNSSDDQSDKLWNVIRLYP